MPEVVWQQCVDRLQDEIPSQQFNTWIRPLRGRQDGPVLQVLAPNRFIKDFVNDKYAGRIAEIASELQLEPTQGGVVVEVLSVAAPVSSVAPAGKAGGWERSSPAPAAIEEPGGNSFASGDERHGWSGTSGTEPYNQAREWQGSSRPDMGDNRPAPALSGYAVQGGANEPAGWSGQAGSDAGAARPSAGRAQAARSFGEAPARDRSFNEVKAEAGSSRGRAENAVSLNHQHKLITNYTFDSFVEGKSNQLALAAARQVAENPGNSYNPLFLYGGVGLGKTHLMHAVGNALRNRDPSAKVVYLHSETFVADMVKALQLNAITEFKRYYRGVDALLIDDIQFFAKKDRSQEEFFHTFNALLEGGQQMILTCDRYPKEIDGLEERLKSRFGWGLTVAVEPPELETRVAILMKKATESRIDLPPDAAFFIAQRIRSNVRELEGALKRVIAHANFTGSPIDIDLIKDSLKDLLALQDKQVSLDNIQRTVAEYYKIKVADLMSRRRSRSVARPRQVAMALAKELTNHSLPEIGDSFGGRDHTTVLHACRKIKELRETNSDIREDYKNLLRSLTT